LNYINFNNAGSSFTFHNSLSIIKNYLDEEKKYGGYYTEKIYRKSISQFYKNASKLINSKSEEISFIPNSTYAWNFFIDSVDIKKPENVVIFDNEYGSNYIKLLKNKINIKVSKLVDGKFLESDLKKKIDRKTRIVFICHVASQCGNVLNIDKLGSFLKKNFPKVLFVIDACQSVGQLMIDVKKNLCDVLVCSGRKYLRGPRGTGFIYIKSIVLKKIFPYMVDLNNAYIKDDRIYIDKKKKIFEVFEHSPALKLGLSNSINQINKYGIKNIQNKILKLSKYFRSKLSKFERVNFHENDCQLSGINTISISGLNSESIHSYLLKKKILTSISSYQTSTVYFKNKKIKDVLRISFHYYNKYTEINWLIKCLIDLLNNK
tara:strand:+ start:886 stop:2013 length:1128 start_codon:yes stop_codon:yes gene_type:complete